VKTKKLHKKYLSNIPYKNRECLLKCHCLFCIKYPFYTFKSFFFFALRLKKKAKDILKKHLLKIISIQDPSFPLFTVLTEIHLHIPEKLSKLH